MAPSATRLSGAQDEESQTKVKTGDDATRVVILGAGPAGLTAAYELSNLGIACVVLEQDAVVGGLARTVEHKGFRFDIGGHRFYTKVSLVQQIWRDVLGDDLLTRRRLSRIYYKSRFFQYPLEPSDAFRGLGRFAADSALCAPGYSPPGRNAISKLGFRIGLAGAFSRRSSRAIRKKSGVWIAAK
jgi:NADPH-dependent 2,4-dienoyl-CoA reductase/sulfur reductase-like enzyme